MFPAREAAGSLRRLNHALHQHVPRARGGRAVPEPQDRVAVACSRRARRPGRWCRWRRSSCSMFPAREAAARLAHTCGRQIAHVPCARGGRVVLVFDERLGAACPPREAAGQSISEIRRLTSHVPRARGGSQPRRRPPRGSHRAIRRPERAPPRPSAKTVCDERAASSPRRVGRAVAQGARDEGRARLRPRSRRGRVRGQGGASDRAGPISGAIRPAASNERGAAGRARAFLRGSRFSERGGRFVRASPDRRMAARGSIRGSRARDSQSVAPTLPPRATGPGRARAVLADDLATGAGAATADRAVSGLVERRLARDHRRRGSSRGRCRCGP